MSLVLDKPRSVASRAEAFREHAEECRRQAEWSRVPADKARWLMIAEKWLKMGIVPVKVVLLATGNCESRDYS
jgi:hypothetical protein